MIVEDNQRFMAERMKARLRSHLVEHGPLVTVPGFVVDIIRAAIVRPLRADRSPKKQASLVGLGGLVFVAEVDGTGRTPVHPIAFHHKKRSFAAGKMYARAAVPSSAGWIFQLETVGSIWLRVVR